MPIGLIFPFENVPTPDELKRAGAHVICSDQSQLIGQDAFYLSGEIPRVTAYEAGLVGQVSRATSNDPWRPDPLVMDECYVSVHAKGRGQFVFSACSHAGIVNVLTHEVVLTSGTAQSRKPYRLSGVLVWQGGRWLWKQFHGSEPAM